MGNPLRTFIVVLLVFLTRTALPAAQEEYLSGTILDKKGNATKISRISAVGEVVGIHHGKFTSIKFSKLKKIENLGNAIFRITNLSDKQYTIERGILATRARGSGRGRSSWQVQWASLELYFFDDIELTEKKMKIGYESGGGHKEILDTVHTITFNQEIGRMKFNPRTKKYFPADYIFDPFSGEKLIWKNPEH